MKIKQCILSMLLAVCLMVWMFPVTALADDSVTVTWNNILTTISSGGTISSDAGWDCDSNNGVIFIKPGTTVSGGDTINFTVFNSGTITGGTFLNQVLNHPEGNITGGTFNGGILNNGGTVAPSLSHYIIVSSANNNSSSTSDSHTHNFNWVITLEPTETTDGVWEYRCECGNVEAKQPASLYEVVIKNIISDIQNAPENGTVTIDHIFLRCLSDEIVAELSARPDVTVQIDFTDKGVAYSLTIPAGQAPTDGQEWYGYYYLGSLYGWTSVVPLA